MTSDQNPGWLLLCLVGSSQHPQLSAETREPECTAPTSSLVCRGAGCHRSCSVPQHLAVKRGAQGITARSGSSGSEQLGVTWQNGLQCQNMNVPGHTVPQSQLLSTADTLHTVRKCNHLLGAQMEPPKANANNRFTSTIGV